MRTLGLECEEFLEVMSILRYARRILRKIILLRNRNKLANCVSKSIRLIKALFLNSKCLKWYLNFIARIGMSLWGRLPQTKLKSYFYFISKPNDFLKLALKLTRSLMDYFLNSRWFSSAILQKPLRSLLETRFQNKQLRFWNPPGLDFLPEPRKVLLVIGTLGGGGAERQLCYLASELRKLEWNPVVAVNNLQSIENQRLRPLLEQEGVKIIEIDSLDAQINPQDITNLKHPIFESALKLSRILNQEKPSVIHSWMDYANCESLLLKGTTKNSKFVVGLRSINPENFIFWSPCFRPIYRKFANDNVELVANSSSGRNSYEQWLRMSSITVIPNGVEVAKLRRRISKSSQQPSTNLKVIGCMRLSEEKGPDIWVEIAKKVCQTNNQIEFHLFGDGPMFNYLKNEVQVADLASRILLHGYQENPWNLQTWDVHLSTSRAEGMPNAIMEATLAGIPSVGFQIGGISEILGSDAKFLVPANDFPKLVDMLLFAINSQENRSAEAKRAKQRVESEFRLKSMALRYIDIYQS